MYFVFFQCIKVANSHGLFNTFITMKKTKGASQDVNVMFLQSLKVNLNDSYKP